MFTMKDNTNLRFQSDRRQFGGMLMITGFCAIIQPLANIVSGFGPDGIVNDEPDDIPLWMVVGAFCLFINGITAVLVGYMACVHDWSSEYLTGFLIIIIQTAFIPYVTDMTNLGKLARESPDKQMLIPPAHNPSEDAIRFVGAMGVMAVFSYGFAFVGSMAFMAFCLHSYNKGAFADRSASYFRGRMGFYCCMLFIGGMVQLLLGIYSAVKFGANELEEGRIRAAMIVVNYPIVSILVGFIQVLNAGWGLARSYGLHNGPTDFTYQLSIALQWVCVLCFQDVMQLSYLDVGTLAALAPGMAAVSFGINMMPAFLDHKMRTLPEDFPDNYYYSKFVSTSQDPTDTQLAMEHAPSVQV